MRRTVGTIVAVLLLFALSSDWPTCSRSYAETSTVAAAPGAPSREYQVKAAMILNFVQFVEWPREAFASDSAPLVIAVVGSNPFGEVLEQLTAGKTLAGRSVVIRDVSVSDKFQGVHVLFVPASEEGNLAQIMKQVKGAPVLSIGETDSFPWSGGIIRFYAEDNKVRFEINPEAADEAHLRISSKLLKLARIFKRS